MSCSNTIYTQMTYILAIELMDFQRKIFSYKGNS